MSDDIVLDAGVLRHYAQRLLAAAGFNADQAATTAEAIVWADLRGHPSHGLMRLPSYLQRADEGLIGGGPDPEVTFRKGALVRIEAHRALGPVALAMAADTAVEQARETGVGWVHVSSHGHGGAIGFYAERIANAGMAGLVMTASLPLMAYPGSRGPALATNPVAIGLPGGLLLDMSTSSIAMGKLHIARRTGDVLPPGAAVDAEGRETRDPHAAAALLPLGGPKGAGLSLMIEALASIAVGNPLLAMVFRDPSTRSDRRQNGIVVAVDLDALGSLADFERNVGELSGFIRALPRADETSPIVTPGERGSRIRKRRLREGVPVARQTWDDLAAAARGLSVTPPVPRP